MGDSVRFTLFAVQCILNQLKFNLLNHPLIKCVEILFFNQIFYLSLNRSFGDHLLSLLIIPGIAGRVGKNCRG